MESQFNFLRVRDGRTYFSRVAVVSDPGSDAVRVLATAGSQNPYAPEQWMEAASLGAEKARQMHLALGGEKIGLTVTSVLGTEADTTDDSIEVASFCAAWKALGHAETDLVIVFDRGWHVRRLA